MLNAIGNPPGQSRNLLAKHTHHKFLGTLFALLVFNSAFLIPNCLCQWVQVSNGMGNVTVYSLLIDGNNIFAGTGNLGGVWKSTNNGDNWTQTSLNNRTVWSLAVNGNNIFAGTADYGVYLSTDNGASWSQTSQIDRTFYSLAVNGNNIFAGCGNTLVGLLLSTNNGISWSQTSLNNRGIYSLATKGDTIYAGTFAYGVYISTNSGTNWNQTSLNNRNVWSLAVNGNNIFAGTVDPSYGVYLSTNNGDNWTQTSLNNRKIWSLAINGNNVFAGTGSSYGVYVSTDNGTSWTPRNEGLTTQAIRAFCILNNYIFAGTEPNGVWRRTLSELTGIQPISNEIPSQFSLSQNYPNPFNPSTNIKFQISKLAYAKLIVFDVLGKEIQTLVNEQLNAGIYEVECNGNGFSSGIYYYKLAIRQAGSSTEDYSETRKMILIK